MVELHSSSHAVGFVTLAINMSAVHECSTRMPEQLSDQLMLHQMSSSDSHMLGTLLAGEKDLLDVVVLPSTGDLRYHNCCIDGGTSLKNFG